MLSFLKKLMNSETMDLKQLLDDGAVVIDVRTPEEFRGGHVKNSINIPVNVIGNKAESLKKHKHIILCCASGGRSGAATSMLKSKGFTNVYNGGSWLNVKRYVH